LDRIADRCLQAVRYNRDVSTNPHSLAFGLVERRAAYYQVLHEQPAFERALHRLLRRLFASEVARARTSQRRARTPSAAEKHRITIDKTRFRAFCRRWALPADGESDLWACLYAASYGAPLRLRAALRVRETAAVDLGKVTIKMPDYTYDLRIDPHLTPEDYLLSVVKIDNGFVSVRRLLIKQAREHYAKAREHVRRQLLPPKFRSRANTLIGARRLYQGAVEKQSWEDIARAEGPGVDPNTVRISVEDWARRLGVPLPKKRRGRPRKL
jgi:hypothetical protein